MTPQEFFSFLLLAFVLSITPGPNNMMVLASGVNFGFRRSVGPVLGVGIGLMVMMLIVGAGLIQMLDRYPLLKIALQAVSMTYLLYLAWKIANAASPKDKRAKASPITFLQAAAFQWINPMAWAMALTSITLYAPSNSWRAIAMVSVVFAIIHIPCVGFWSVLGQQLRNFINGERRLRIFNGVMASLLLISLVPVIFAMNEKSITVKTEVPVVQSSLEAPPHPPNFVDVVWLDLQLPSEKLGELRLLRRASNGSQLPISASLVTLFY